MQSPLLNPCRLCPRECGARRTDGQRGMCHADTALRVARAALHFWEEPCLSGETGSGTVFFSGCSLGCIYCQNHEIAAAEAGKEISVPRLSDIFLELEAQGALNINLVTPTHYVPHIIEALNLAKQKKLALPIVYNSGGYEKAETLRLLDGAIDLYLPDFKYISSSTAAEYSNAPDYPEIAKTAIAEMIRQVGKALITDEHGIAKKGVIVRHLILPGHIAESKRIIRYLTEHYGKELTLSLMSQYTPMPHMKNHPFLGRKLTEKEYESVLDFAIRIGVENAFVQDGEAASESFIPPFNCQGV